MIVRFAKPGKSFRGLAAYLNHDPGKAKTSERVAWTHTLNLANDDIGLALDEVLWTYRAADELKRQAGISTGGRKLENPVRHVSLNWAPSDTPSREQMIEAAQDLLRHLGYDDRQAILFAHNDKHYRHVHIMLNSVSPIDGRSLDAGFEHYRASAWALQYERSQFQIHCEERLKPYDEREPSPTREAWQKLKEAEKQNEKDELERLARTPDYFERNDPDTHNAKEWELLKGQQRHQRDAFFVEGKQAFRDVRKAVLREVRTEFRNDWMTYFDSKRRGMDADSLAEMKADIVSRQNAELECRRDAACKELRNQRDWDYQHLLRQQREQKQELKERQAQGLTSPHLLGLSHDRDESGVSGCSSDTAKERAQAFGETAAEICAPPAEKEETKEREQTPDAEAGESYETPAGQTLKVHDGLNIAGSLGLGALGGLASVADRLLDGFLGGTPAPKPRPKAQPEPARNERESNLRREIEARSRTAEKEATEAEQLHAYWQERGRRRGRDRD